jgi:hypothetical protein
VRRSKGRQEVGETRDVIDDLAVRGMREEKECHRERLSLREMAAGERIDGECREHPQGEVQQVEPHRLGAPDRPADGVARPVSGR